MIIIISSGICFKIIFLFLLFLHPIEKAQGVPGVGSEIYAYIYLPYYIYVFLLIHGYYN